MKKILFTILWITLLQISYAQITRSGSFTPGTTTYPMSGDVVVTLSGNTISVDFQSNFSTVQGITLEVFLSKTNNLNTSTDILISTAPLDSGTAMSTPITGMRSFTVPTGTNLYEYDNVIVQCTSANVRWGHANLCENTVNLAASPLPSDTYRGEQNIVSSSMVANSSLVAFEAETMITLSDNFEVPSTTDFQAVVGPTYGCTIQ